MDGAFPFPRTELPETGLQTFQAGPRKNYGHVYVAVAADRAHYVGMIACIGSVFAAARDPYRLCVSAIIPARGVRDTSALRRALKCRVRRGHVDVVEFDARKYMKRVDVKAPRGPGYGNLRSPANFARFFLPELLPDADRVVYLDADAIVVRDVAALYDTSLTASTPGFSHRHDLTHEVLIDMALDLRFAEVAETIETIFPISQEAAEAFSALTEPSDIAAEQAGYPEIKRGIADPLRWIDGAIKEISVGIAHFYGAYG